MKQGKPFFSIIIPCYNYGHFLDRALTSLQKQGEVNFETLVIDDGSSDNTRDIALKYLEHDKYLFQNNSGPATARNYGIRESRGAYIIFLDADDTLEPDVLPKLKEILSKNQKIDCLIGSHKSIFPNGRTKHIPQPQLPNSAEKCFIAYLEKNLRVCNGAMVIARHVFDSLCFPEELRSCEDIPFFARLLLNYSCQTTQQTIANIYKHPDSLRHNSQRAEQSRLRAIDIIFKHSSTQLLQQYKNKYTAKAYLSLFRTQYKAKNFEDAKINYYKAIKNDRINLLNFAILMKVVKILCYTTIGIKP